MIGRFFRSLSLFARHTFKVEEKDKKDEEEEDDDEENVRMSGAVSSSLPSPPFRPSASVRGRIAKSKSHSALGRAAVEDVKTSVMGVGPVVRTTELTQLRRITGPPMDTTWMSTISKRFPLFRCLFISFLTFEKYLNFTSLDVNRILVEVNNE